MIKFSAKLIRKIQLNSDVYQFDFKWQELVPFKAGQFLMIEVPDGDKKLTRAYSISSAPSQSDGFSFCVKILADGKASQYLIKMKEGDEAQFMGPFGHFVLAESSKPILMIATGTGLAPFMGMLPSLFETNYAGQINLLFGVRHEEDLFYVKELMEMEKVHANFKATITLSQASEAWAGARGRVSEYLNSIDVENLQVYICGNGDMVKNVKDILESKGLPKADLHLEQFTPMTSKTV